MTVSMKASGRTISDKAMVFKLSMGKKFITATGIWISTMGKEG